MNADPDRPPVRQSLAGRQLLLIAVGLFLPAVLLGGTAWHALSRLSDQVLAERGRLAESAADRVGAVLHQNLDAPLGSAGRERARPGDPRPALRSPPQAAAPRERLPSRPVWYGHLERAVERPRRRRVDAACGDRGGEEDTPGGVRKLRGSARRDAGPRRRAARWRRGICRRRPRSRPSGRRRAPVLGKAGRRGFGRPRGRPGDHSRLDGARPGRRGRARAPSGRWRSPGRRRGEGLGAARDPPCERRPPAARGGGVRPRSRCPAADVDPRSDRRGNHVPLRLGRGAQRPAAASRPDGRGGADRRGRPPAKPIPPLGEDEVGRLGRSLETMRERSRRRSSAMAARRRSWRAGWPRGRRSCPSSRAS